jgi:hypothetical protein
MRNFLFYIISSPLEVFLIQEPIRMFIGSLPSSNKISYANI